MEKEGQEEQKQRAVAVQAGARCRHGNYLGWPAQDLVSQRFLFSLSCFFVPLPSRVRMCVFATKERQARWCVVFVPLCSRVRMCVFATKARRARW